MADQAVLSTSPSSSASRRAICGSTRSTVILRMYHIAPAREPSESRKNRGRASPNPISRLNRDEVRPDGLETHGQRDVSQAPPRDIGDERGRDLAGFAQVQ